MSRNKGNKVTKKKQHKNRQSQKYKCLECLDMGVLDKDYHVFPCPYCAK